MGVPLTGKLDTCPGCAVGKSIRLAIPSHTTDQAVRKLGRVLMDLNGKKAVSSPGGHWNNAIIHDEFSRLMRVYPPKANSHVYEALQLFLAENNADKAEHVVLAVRSKEEGEFWGGRFSALCK
ncbi:unnamed protein product, partial [Discosporangium mesarthrocarpum]